MINSTATDQIKVFDDLNTSRSKTKILRALYKHSVLAWTGRMSDASAEG